MTAVLDPPARPLCDAVADRPPQAHQVSEGPRRPLEGRVVFGLSFLAYLVVAVLCDFVFHVFPLDAVSRTANAFYVLYARDPHLAAIGFVWNPLPSIAELPLLVFEPFWHGLVANDFAGSLVSVLAMSGAVYQLLAALTEWGIGRGPRLVLTACFALNPMILYYAGNGMSEGLYVFTLLATSRYLLRWMRQGDQRSLVYAAIWLALGYLARDEVVGAALLAGPLVGWLSYRRAAPGGGRSRLMTALCDLAIFEFPVVVAFVTWSVTSYIIVGHPFEQFSSQYGNSSQIAINGSVSTVGNRLVHELKSIEYLAPLLLIVVFCLFAGAVMGRIDRDVLAPLAVLGGGLGFSALSYLGGATFPWLRFYILVIPLDMLLVGALVVGLGRRQGSESGGRRVGRASLPEREPEPDGWVPPRPKTRSFGSFSGAGLAVLALLAVGPSVVTTAAGMFNPTIGSEETQDLGFVFHAKLTPEDHAAEVDSSAWADIAGYLTRMRLPNGDVVVDTFTGCVPAVDLTITTPKIFVITPDRDFQKVLADPLTFNAHYLLLPPPTGLGQLEAINKAYPDMYRTGDGWAQLAHQFPPRGECPALRLYHVTGHPTQAGPIG